MSISFRRAVVIAIGIGAVAFPAAADAAKPKRAAKPEVMTRNLYLGADLGPAITAPSVPEAYTAVGDIYKNMQDMNFNARAKLLVNEIEDAQPDLIGLQEVSLWRRDDVVDEQDTTPTAEEVVYDYLELLMDEIARRDDLSYSVAVVQEEADLQFPADTGGGPDDSTDGIPDFEGRLTMRDVILVKDGVKVRDADGANYPINANVNTEAFGPVNVKRGYVYADVVVKRRTQKFRFINTHLESFSSQVRTFQAGNLTSASEVTDTGMPTILVGDLNSDPVDPDPQDGAYETVIADGFTDLGVEQNTCCFGEDLRDPVPVFTSRIDHVMGKIGVTELSSELIGTNPDNRTGTGLWPTDHGGVVATLKVAVQP